jgi:hypothetical protein
MDSADVTLDDVDLCAKHGLLALSNVALVSLIRADRKRKVEKNLKNESNSSPARCELIRAGIGGVR